jgi:hypothetical protein
LKKTGCLLAISLVSLSASANPNSIVGDGLLWVGDFGRGIYTIDPITGQSVKRLDVNVGSTVINDLAFDPTSGLLYGISGGGLYGTPNTLFTVNLTSPSLAVTYLGIVSTPTLGSNSISGIAFVGGSLIASEWTGNALADKLFTINLSDLSYSNVRPVSSPANYNIADLTSVGQTSIVASLQASPVGIFSVNSVTGSASNLTTLSTPATNFGPAYSASSGNFYTGDSNRNVWEINATTYATHLVGAVPILGGGIAGLEYVSTASPVPEASQAALLFTGLAFLAAYVRSTRRRGEA